MLSILCLIPPYLLLILLTILWQNCHSRTGHPKTATNAQNKQNKKHDSEYNMLDPTILCKHLIFADIREITTMEQIVSIVCVSETVFRLVYKIPIYFELLSS